jgi:formylglycine-generating enzyme required for sulfatase activity
MRSHKSQFGFLALAFLLGSASVRAQLPPETTQPPVPGKDSTNKATLNEPQQPAPTLAAGTVKENPKDGLKYVWIPPGTFMMGCSPGDNECSEWEKPAHAVTISKGFWLGQTVVTVGAYKRLTAGAGQQMPPAPRFNSGWTNGGALWTPRRRSLVYRK